MFELWLFTSNGILAKQAEAAGIKGIIIDWEQRDKEERQLNKDFECNKGTFEDLVRVSNKISSKVICRINSSSPLMKGEIDLAIKGGANVIFLPLVRDEFEVEEFVKVIDGRAESGVLIETDEAVKNASKIAKLPIDYAYVGLNDLSISRNYDNIFKAVSDGVVEDLRSVFMSQKFGFGGVTIVSGGYPIPAHLLIKEMSRLGCDFSFLRRSFKKDIFKKNMNEEVEKILIKFDKYKKRTFNEINDDINALRVAIDYFDIKKASKETEKVKT